MVDTPKTAAKARAVKGARSKVTPAKSKVAVAPAMLSATQALKAAEKAVDKREASVTKKAAARPKVARTVAEKASPSKPAPPVAVVTAATAVDAAPEPAPMAEAPVTKTKPAASNTTTEVKPVSPVVSTFAEGTTKMNDVIETSKKFAEDAKAKLETAFAGMNEKAKAGVEKSTKALEEISDLAKGNVEALVESGKIAAKGVEAMGQEAAEYSRKSLEKATASMKSFASVKTPTEFFQLQSQLFSTSFDEFTKEAAKSSEAFMKLAGDVAQPLSARVTVVTEKVKALAA